MIAITKLTYADYAQFPDNDGNRYEIIDGEMCKSSLPGEAHQRILRGFVDQLDAHVRERELGQVFSAPYTVILGPHDIVVPDCLFISQERGGIVGPTAIDGAPDLCVELASPATQRRDRTLKADRYALLGVAEYWIVDLATRRVETFALERGAYLPLGVFGKNAPVTSYVLPDWQPPASVFFPNA